MRRFGRVGNEQQNNEGKHRRLRVKSTIKPVRVKWLGLDKQGRRLEGLGMKQAASAAEAASRLKVLREHGWSSCRACAVYSRGAEWLHQETILARAGGRGGAERRGLAPGRPIANLADYAAVGEAVRRLESQRKADRDISAACRQVLKILEI